MKPTERAVVFDFDGTLADSMLASLAVAYELFHHRPLPREDVSRLRGMATVRLLRELHIPLWRGVFLAPRARRHMRVHMSEVELVPDMKKAIQELSGHYKLFILTSNDVANVHLFCVRYGLEPYFSGIRGKAVPWAKERMLRKLVATYALNPAETWYVGDSAWDVRAARQTGMKAAAVTWGFSNLHVLKRSRPDALVFSADELISCLLNNLKNEAN